MLATLSLPGIHRLARLLALAATLPASLSVYALPAITSYAAYGYDNQPQNASYTVFTAGSDVWLASNASFAAEARLGAPFAQAYVGTSGWDSTHLSNKNANASAAVQYDFLVDSGGVFSDVVPLTIRGRYYLTASGAGAAGGYVKVGLSGTAGGIGNSGVLGRTNFSFGCMVGGDDCGKLVDFEFHLNISGFGAADPGVIGRLSLLASARIQDESQFSSSASAWVDPVFEIDPVWAASHPNAKLLLGPSVTNSLAAAPVPEPATAGLMGLGAAALWLRRRRS